MSAGSAPVRPMSEVIAQHAARYPLWTAEDAYKLIHQAAMGSEHAAPTEEVARTWLEREFAQMGSGPDEPLIDPISPDGSIVRVHLRPYARRGLDPELLLEAFLRTAVEFRGSRAALERGLGSALSLAAAGALGTAAVEVRQVVERARAAGYPAVHHSVAFVAAYRPAYRVVDIAFLAVDAQRASR